MTNFRKLFNREDFRSVSYGPKTQEQLAEIAQSILNEALDKATVVYSNNRKGKDFLWCKHKLTNDTHKALLIQVEPIKECEHIRKDLTDDMKFWCRDCGKELIPTGFKVKE